MAAMAAIQSATVPTMATKIIAAFPAVLCRSNARSNAEPLAWSSGPEAVRIR